MKSAIVPENCPAPLKAQAEAIETEHFIFFSGQMPTDYAAGLAPETVVPDEVALCGPPEMVRQTRYMLQRMEKVIESAGSGFEDLVRIEQFIIGRDQAPWYSSARQSVMTKGHPTSTRVCAKALEVPGALIACDGFSLNPRSSWTKETHDLDIVPGALTGYPAAQSAGPFVLMPGMIATVRLQSKVADQRVVIANDWLVTKPDGLGVFVLHDGQARYRTVKLGPIVGNRVVIESGLKVGDELVITGHRELADGDALLVARRGVCCREGRVAFDGK